MCSLDGVGKYWLYGCDHDMRVRLIYSCNIEDAINHLENCGGHIP